MELVKLYVEYEAYYSGAEYYEEMLVSRKFFNKFKDEIANCEVFLGELDGKHSECSCEISYLLNIDPSTYVPDTSDGDCLYYALYDEIDNKEVDAEVRMIDDYLKTIDKPVKVTIRIKESQQEALKVFLDSLKGDE